MLIEGVNTEAYSQCRIPGIAVTLRGTLIAYYECRKTNSDWADIDIKIIKSTDEGKTWRTVKLIKGNGNTLNNPVLFVKGSELHFLFLKNYKQLFHSVSIDDGEVFSEPVEKKLSCTFFYNAVAVGPGHGIVHKGKMVVPIWFAQNKEDSYSHQPSVISTLYSTDGEEWHIGELIGNDIFKNPSECALAVTADNKVLISVRNENGCRRRGFALSDNGYENWYNIHFAEQMADPICMGSMCYENGKIYHINCDSSALRENLTVKISDNCFKSFTSIPVDTPAGYSDIAVKDGAVYVFYERDCNKGGLHFKKIKL